MRHNKKTPIYIQAKRLAKKQKLTDAQLKQWRHLLITAYIVGGDNTFSTKNKPMIKPIIVITYNDLQSKSGKLNILQNDKMISSKYFESLIVDGNNLVIYVSDNGKTEKGRIGGIYNLSDYSVRFI